ncbi:hypothetical protein RhiirA1_468827 [Rhizophagus irregularis]|uniref:Protein kinase domain-containing protein n=2 Tax=Rhizophagus irregularis TaxID=588596 RepID=A0A2N0R996_9GLOM|nr:hypothetical protein RhiirA1_468827 [Rhizophagus irregularis]
MNITSIALFYIIIVLCIITGILLLYVLVFLAYPKDCQRKCTKCMFIYYYITGRRQCQPNYLRKSFTNWTSGNEKIDNFIQEKQIDINGPFDIVFEWIPYHQFTNIKEMNEDSHSAIWMDGPLYWKIWNKEYIRLSDFKVVLKYSYNIQSINEFLSNVKQSLIINNNMIYGISQDPNTKDYIIVFQDMYCKKCSETYTIIPYKWCKSCKSCQIKDLTNLISSGSEKIDNFVQENINGTWNMIVFEWIPYNQFTSINEMNEDSLLAIWTDGPLYWETRNKKYTRTSNVGVVLKYLYNIQSIDEFLNKVRQSFNIYKNNIIYGISQNPNTMDYIIVFQDLYCEKCDKKYSNEYHRWCKNCSINYLRENFTEWTSRNRNIDNFVKKMQLKISDYDNKIFEWIPYNQFINIKELNKDDFFTLYSVKWKNGPLYWDTWNIKCVRRSDIEIVLKYPHNLQSIGEFLNEVKEHSINFEVFGISQNPDTGKYVMAFQEKTDKKYCIKCSKVYTNVDKKWCKQCSINYLRKNFTNWTSENEKINNFIQGKQIEINYSWNNVFEWIPYNQFTNIKETNEDSLSATWIDGPLYWETWNKEYIRRSNVEVILKYSHNIQHIDEFLSKVEQSLIIKNNMIYGISQDPNTNYYIIIIQDIHCEKCDKDYTNISYKWCKTCQIKDLLNWTSGNEKIDNFIQEKQIEINDPSEIVFEWIPYNQFNNIKEVNKDKFSTVYSAKWMDGPLFWEIRNKKYLRGSDKELALKYLHSLQNIEGFLNKVKQSLIINNSMIYGISQDPNTKDYLIVFQDVDCEKCNEKYTNMSYKWCKSCQINDLLNWISGNEKIDNFIQKMQMEINDPFDVVIEWIPYNQFNDIKEVSKNKFSTVYSAKWIDGPLYWGIIWNNKKYIRESNKEVALKCSHNLQNIDEFLSKVKQALINKNEKIYGISQNPITREYIIVSNDVHYMTKNRISGNEKIDNLIQEMKSKINDSHDIIFDWIPYSQFYNIKEIDKGGFATVYAAVWKDGPSYYGSDKKQANKKVALKCLYNSLNITTEFLNEIKKYSVNNYGSNILRIYGLSQNPNTKEYIMVLEYAEGGNFNNWMNKNYRNFSWLSKINTLYNISNGLKEIHQKKIVHRDLHTGNILFFINDISMFDCNMLSISDMGLCGEVDNIDKMKIYGVMPYVAPEMLRGKPYTQAADIYSFGMIMYFTATGRQPFANFPHDKFLVLGICNGIRPEIDELEAPKYYIDLMKKCWDPNPENRPNSFEIYESVLQFQNNEIEEQFKEVEEYRKANLLSNENNQSATHPQAVYISRSLNSFTDCLDCRI